MNQKIKIQPTKKTYYHNLKYKIVVDGELKYDEYWEILKNGNVWGDEPFAFNSKILRNKDTTHFYIKTKDVFDNLLKYFNGKIQHCEEPINSYHSELLDKFDVDIKKTLYYRKYRYKSKFGTMLSDGSTSRESIIKAIQSLVRSNSDMFMCMGLYNYSTSAYSWIMPTIYVRNKEGLMLLKLATGEITQHINKVITIKEIEDEKRISE
ncbi:MAG: hypothetical protein CBC05_02810 [Crocinitomicaceae bacterium TMED45]|nr:MAG: hypothetical protein CBC05_02810 [Crocinitomicaceae bacterium TMED45]|tara:strand:+ start:13976 stop:14599 length:624 start_codon:yes stop_codon:yes gene_type:complete